MPTRLPADATIQSVYLSLSDPKRYVSSVLAKMRKCQRTNGDTAVRIGITGSGQKPCYRIVYKDPQEDEKIYGSWWDTGDELPNEEAINQNWSKASSRFKELEDFFAEKIGHSGPRPKL